MPSLESAVLYFVNTLKLLYITLLFFCALPLRGYVMDNTKKGYFIAADASSVFSDGYVGLKGREEYNEAVSHVFDLMRASYTLFNTGSFGPSLFLSITIFEEVAKVRTRMWDGERKNVKRGKDPLFSHQKKHKISVDPLYLSAERLISAIGNERLQEIFKGYESGDYSSLREDSLYFARNIEGLHIPAKVIGLRLAAEHLLMAIELFCEIFWGTTGEASIICDGTDDLFVLVADVLKRSD